jgi:hypothetical protein
MCSSFILGYFLQVGGRNLYTLHVPPVPSLFSFRKIHLTGSLQQLPHPMQLPRLSFEMGRNAVKDRLAFATHVFLFESNIIDTLDIPAMGVPTF